MNRYIRVVYFIIISLSLLLFSCSNYKEIDITPVSVRDIEVCTFSDAPLWNVHKHITYEQAVEDADDICYLLNTCYIAYDEMLKKGFSEKTFLAAVKDQFADCNLIQRDEFCNFLYVQLSPYIQDAHASIEGQAFYQDADIFFSDYYVRQSARGYEIVEPSPDEYVGSIITECLDEYLFRYPSKGENVFRLGIVSVYPFSEITVQTASGPLSITLEKEDVIEKTEDELSAFSTDDSLYIKCSTFDPDNLPDKQSLDAFVGYADLVKQKKYAIIDVRENGGGLGMYQFNFLKAIFMNEEKSFGDYVSNRILLYKIDTQSDSSTYICSPLIVKSLSAFRDHYVKDVSVLGNIKSFNTEYQNDNPHRSLVVSRNTTGIRSNYKTEYSGTLIFLIDRNSASAAEALCIEAKSVFPESQVYILGENSFGAMSNGTPLQYVLKHSRIIVSLPIQRQGGEVAYFQGEGIGIYPDYWSTTEDLNETINFITGDSKMRSLLTSLFYKETH